MDRPLGPGPRGQVLPGPRTTLARWVWEHTFTEADFTNWGDNFPTMEDNIKDCAAMSFGQGWRSVLAPWILCFCIFTPHNMCLCRWVDQDCGEALAAPICQMTE